MSPNVSTSTLPSAGSANAAPDEDELDAGKEVAADEDEPAEDPDVGVPVPPLLLEVPAARDELPGPPDVDEEDAAADVPDDGADDVLLGGREPPLVTMLDEPLLLLDAVPDAPDDEASPPPVPAQPANNPATMKTTNVTLANARIALPHLVNTPL